MREAMFYEKAGTDAKCLLCPHGCSIPRGGRGRCRVRTNIEGILHTENYGIITSIALDPIEKKPLYHFKPGTNILSVGSYGCNFTCSFCQNHAIAQDKAEGEYVSPERMAEITASAQDNIGIAFTYNEPSIWYEYVYDTSLKIKEGYPNLKIVLVTNGFMEPKALEQLLPYVDAMNIDLKAFNKEYYRRVCGGEVEGVLRIIEAAHERCHIEITTLVVNGLNDSMDEIRSLCSYLASLDKDIPLHLSRYYPTYKMDVPSTPVDALMSLWEISKEYLNYVYVGNVANIDNSTYCPKCEKMVIKRGGFYSKVLIEENTCPKCGYHIKAVL